MIRRKALVIQSERDGLNNLYPTYLGAPKAKVSKIGTYVIKMTGKTWR